MNTRWYTLRIILALLLAGVWVACLFSLFLPSSAALLAPTSTLIPTRTKPPTATLTPTSTFTPLPQTLVTPSVIEIFPFGVYDQRQVWESAVGKMVVSEDFEKDIHGPGELQFPYMTGNRFLLTGKSNAQILVAPELLDSGNFLHFRAWEQGLTFTFPDDRAVAAFGFDYTTSEEWQLTVSNLDVIMPSGRNQFMGIILLQNSSTKFRLVSSAFAQGGLSVDDISYIP